MPWFIRDTLIVVGFAAVGAVIGGVFGGSTPLGAPVVRELCTKLFGLPPHLSEEQKLSRWSPTLKIISAWTCACAIFTGTIVWRVHWIAAQSTVALEQFEPYIWGVNGPVWACWLAIVAFQTFKSLRYEFAVAGSLALSVPILVANSAAFCLVLLIISVFAHLGAGGGI